MGKEIATHIQDMQSSPYSMNSRKNMLRHILIKIKIKFKEKILKVAREKQQKLCRPEESIRIYLK